MKVKEYSLLDMCVENGVQYGYQRAFKYYDDPDDNAIKRAIHDAIMSEICEWFDFDDQNTIES